MPSAAFQEMIKQLNTVGTAYKDGYSNNLLSNIPDDEREEAEKIILDKFSIIS